MSKHYQDEISLRDGKIKLYKNSQTKNSQNWQMRILRPDGGYVTRSTKTANIADACRLAEDEYDDMRTRFRSGAPVSDVKFKDLYLSWWKATNTQIKSSDRREFVQKQFERYYLPFFGEMYSTKITTSTLTDYWVWRLSYWTTGPGTKIRDKVVTFAKTPSYQTLKGEHGSFMKLMRWAHNHGIIGKLPMTEIPVPAQRKKDTARPAFTSEEVTLIKNWLKDVVISKGYTHYPNDYGQRMFRNYVLLGFASGMRPNEIFSLKWRHIERLHEDDTNYYIVSVPLETKTGHRTTVPLPGMFGAAINDLKMFSKYTDPDDYILTTWKGNRIQTYVKQFHNMTNALGIPNDKFGDRRVPYSMRHTYITLRILEGGVSKDDIARNVGTSVDEIDQHYDHVLNQQRAKELTAMKVKPEDKKYNQSLNNILRKGGV